MVATRANVAPSLSPEQIADLLIKPLGTESVAGQVSTVIETGRSSFRIPMVSVDPIAAWVNEGQEIAPSDMTFDEDVVRFSKLAGLNIITREAAADTSPAATDQIGAGLVRDMTRKLDAAFFGDLAAPAPKGLDSLPVAQNVDAGPADQPWANLDAFAEAVSLAADLGVETTSFVCNSKTRLELATLKAGTGSNVPLLTSDPTQPARRTIEGLPVLVSPYVADGVIWAVPKSVCYLVIREDAKVETTSDTFFTSDRIGIKATIRVGFGFAYPEAVVKISRTTA